MTPLPDMSKISAQKEVSVVIVDSGMGGLSICAELVEGLRSRQMFERVAVTYFNAWPEQSRGYNALSGEAERIRVFDRALLGTLAFAPDTILIACNTLSILYPQTDFRRQATLPVVGIVDFGVDMIHQHLVARPDSQVIILGTKTTIAADEHRQALLDRGIDDRRIVSQACDQLATEIEKDPHGPVVRSMVEHFVRQAVEQAANPEAHAFAALCCTHYGYSADVFQTSLDTRFAAGCTILDPNQAMAEGLLTEFSVNRHYRTEIDVQVVSRIVWNAQQVTAIAGLTERRSPVTAEALKNYRHDAALFTL